MISAISPEPFPGFRPFDVSDARTFFGRGTESRHVFDLIGAHSLLVIHGPSGSGKTSLLQAGVLPLLSAEEGCEVLAPVRLGGIVDAPDDVQNPYVAGAVKSWARDGHPLDASPPASLREYLNRWKPASRIVVFDQVEDLFIHHPEWWQARANFLRQIEEAVAADRRLSVVLIIREEFLGQLEAYAGLFRERLRVRYRMEPLRSSAAVEALRRPLEEAGYPFESGVAERLVSDLTTTRVMSASGEETSVQGEFVDPVQLQVLGRTIWAALTVLGPEIRTIDESLIARIGGIDKSLREYYESGLATTATESGIEESRLRRLFEDVLITPRGTRGTLFRGSDASAGVPNRALAMLVNSRLLRQEMRAGALWYELPHDRLIPAILESNRKWRQQRVGRTEFETLADFEARAAAWEGSGRPSKALLSSDELADIDRFQNDAALEGHAISDALRRIAQASRHHEQQHLRRQLLRARIVVSVLSLVCGLLALALITMIFSRR